MKEKFFKALEKISSELLDMNQDEYMSIIENHKHGEYANTLKSINFLLTDDIYKLQKTNVSVSFETPKIDFKTDDIVYETTQTEKITIKIRTLNIEDDGCLSLAA